MSSNPAAATIFGMAIYECLVAELDSLHSPIIAQALVALRNGAAQ